MRFISPTDWFKVWHCEELACLAIHYVVISRNQFLIFICTVVRATWPTINYPFSCLVALPYQKFRLKLEVPSYASGSRIL